MSINEQHSCMQVYRYGRRRVQQTDRGMYKGVKRMDVSLHFFFYFTSPTSMGCTLLRVRIVACRFGLCCQCEEIRQPAPSSNEFRSSRFPSHSVLSHSQLQSLAQSISSLFLLDVDSCGWSLSFVWCGCLALICRTKSARLENRDLHFAPVAIFPSQA